MKKILLFLFALSITNSALAQGTQLHTGVPVYHLSQKIGIGTANPAYLLDVNGLSNFSGNMQIGSTSSHSLWIGSNVTSQGSAKISNGRFEGYWGGESFPRLQFHRDIGGSGLGGIGFGSGGAAIDTKLYRSATNTLMTDGGFNINGNVGIGTISPTQQLDIYSPSAHSLRLSTNAYANDQKIEFHAVSGTYHSIVSNANSGNLQIRAGDVGSGHEVLFFTDGVGRVGVTSSGGLAVGNSYYNQNAPSNSLVVEGDLGIGTTSPAYKLDVNGRIHSNNKITGDRLSATGGIIDLDAATGNNFWQLYSGAATLYVSGTSGISQKGGNVGIGTSSPTEKLAVDGTILTKKIRVSAAGADWPDYVFEPNFKLRTLTELEEFVQTNKHLPEVPSAKEVEANGLDLGKMDATLLKKVEELTLYLIQENKSSKLQAANVKVIQEENAQLKKDNQELKEMFQLLKTEIENLKKSKK